MEYKIIAYAAIALVAMYVAIKLAGQWAINKVVQAEFEHVLNNDEHKVKGRFQ